MLSTSFSFAFVSNSAVVAEKVQTYAQEHGWPLEEVRLATMEEALPVAKQLFDQGVDVILGGGGTGKLLRRHLNEPVVTISRSHMSILQALMEAREYTDNVAVTCYDAIPPWPELFSRPLHIRLQPIRFTNSRELTLGITQAIAQGAGCVVGGGVCVSIAQAHHCPGIVVCPGNEALERAFEEASNIAQARRRDREHAAWLQDVVDALHEGVIGVDPAGKLALSNPVARQALGQDRLRDGWALQHLGLAESLETGRPTEGTLKGENGQDLVFTSSAVVVDGIQKGALSVLTPDVVLTDLQRRLKHSRQAGLRAKFTLNDLLGESPSMRTLRVHAQRFAESDAGIYIHGESGTGKELLAHAIHNASPRRHAPFVAVNCGALPESLLESELFGYERGAFTGAQHRRIGRIEQAAGGTIFLDEIGDMPPGIQAKLLRLLQEKQIQRLGGHDSVDVDVRIIAATNANLEQAVADGRFREDLYYRLKVVTLWTPPLRERREDIPALAAFLLHRQAAELHRPDPGLEEDALRYLAGLDWPGNVRELSNALQKALVFNSGAPVSIRDLQLVLDSPAGHPLAAGPGLNGNGDAVPAPGVRRSPVGTGNGIHEGEGPYEDASAPAPAAAPHNDEQRSLASIVTACLQSGDPSPFDTCMDIMGRAVVREALRQCRGNRSQAARLLGLSRPTLLARMEKYGLKIETRISDE